MPIQSPDAYQDRPLVARLADPERLRRHPAAMLRVMSQIDHAVLLADRTHRAGALNRDDIVEGMCVQPGATRFGASLARMKHGKVQRAGSEVSAIVRREHRAVRACRARVRWTCRGNRGSRRTAGVRRAGTQGQCRDCRGDQHCVLRQETHGVSMRPRGPVVTVISWCGTNRALWGTMGAST